MGTVMSSGKIKIQSNTVYTVSSYDLSNPAVLGVVISRMWWKPWRWKVTPLYYGQRGAAGHITGANEGEPTSNLTLLGAIGMAKLLGVEHKDFEGK